MAWNCLFLLFFQAINPWCKYRSVCLVKNLCVREHQGGQCGNEASRGSGLTEKGPVPQHQSEANWAGLDGTPGLPTSPL